MVKFNNSWLADLVVSRSTSPVVAINVYENFTF